MSHATLPVEATNWHPDPGFENGVLRHDVRIVTAGVTDTTSIVRTPIMDGAYSLRISCSANASGVTNGDLIVVGWKATTTIGKTWWASVDYAFVTAGLAAGLSFAWYQADGGLISSTAVVTGTSAAPNFLETAVHTAPARAASVQLRLSLRTTATAGLTGQAVFDNVMFSDAARDYFTGDTSRARWQGEPHLSPSVLYGEDPALEDILDWVPPYYYSRAGVIE